MVQRERDYVPRHSCRRLLDSQRAEAHCTCRRLLDSQRAEAHGTYRRFADNQRAEAHGTGGCTTWVLSRNGCKVGMMRTFTRFLSYRFFSAFIILLYVRSWQCNRRYYLLSFYYGLWI